MIFILAHTHTLHQKDEYGDTFDAYAKHMYIFETVSTTARANAIKKKQKNQKKQQMKKSQI